MKNIVCNILNTQSNTTGVQRYTNEIVKRISNNLEIVKPNNVFAGIKGHIWEQTVLPLRLKGRLLWSPANTGPLSIKNQVISIMDMSPIDHPEWFSKRFSKWYQYMVPKLINNCKTVITISNFSKSRIIYHCPNAEDKIHVTHLAAHENFKNTQHLYTRNNLNLPSKKYILALGSLEPRKNLNFLLNAWENILNKIPDDTYLVVSGLSSYKNIFADFSFKKIPQRVHFTGYIEDAELPNLYSNAIALTYTPLYEGFGLPPLEAMSCGIPVITSNNTSIPEVVGDAAIKINPNDVDECSDAIYRIIHDEQLRKKLSTRGLIKSKKFSWDLTANKTLEILEKAL